jgi:hypothetical protein
MSSNRGLKAKRSFTGHHNLLPAVRPSVPVKLIPEVRLLRRLLSITDSFQVPTITLVAWTFGRGSVVSEGLIESLHYPDRPRSGKYGLQY